VQFRDLETIFADDVRMFSNGFSHKGPQWCLMAGQDGTKIIGKLSLAADLCGLNGLFWGIPEKAAL
jgi:hypothetical protein